MNKKKEDEQKRKAWQWFIKFETPAEGSYSDIIRRNIRNMSAISSREIFIRQPA